MPECGICERGVSKEKRALASCGDVFHPSCIKEYMKSTGGAGLTCPVCFDFFELAKKKKATKKKDEGSASAKDDAGAGRADSSSPANAENPAGPAEEPSAAGTGARGDRAGASAPADEDPSSSSSGKSRKRRRSVSFAEKELGQTGRGRRSLSERIPAPRSILRRRKGDIPKPLSSGPDWYCKACEEVVPNKDKQTHILSIGHNLKAHEVKRKHHKGERLQTGLASTSKGYQMLVRLGWDQKTGLGAENRKGRTQPIATQLSPAAASTTAPTASNNASPPLTSAPPMPTTDNATNNNNDDRAPPRYYRYDFSTLKIANETATQNSHHPQNALRAVEIPRAKRRPPVISVLLGASEKGSGLDSPDTV
mmetsp:Transcript_25252/g.60767  ORF Transcript_25252/g.60767 Transcript_25252/m.60767 type:complete len:366 (+) Transcript_25252:259-1356(+)